MPEGHRTRKIVARVLVAVLLGIATGYAVGTSLASDAARGRALTIKEYVANFDEYKKHLLGNDSPMWAAVIAGSTSCWRPWIAVAGALRTSLARRPGKRRAGGPTGRHRVS